ncbi:MAG: CBS domain-containing protein [Frankiaceae bacterium]|jgi:CBS domain-containing protein|nr:CBS domain-containing protein [Frankiaceae bacterium]
MHLSQLLGQTLVTESGEPVARVEDVIVRLRGAEYPLVTGLVGRVSGRAVFIASERIADWSALPMRLTDTALSARPFERRDGEVLLRTDVLGHRLIDVAEAELVRAYEVEFTLTADGLAVSCLDTRRPARLFGLLRQGAGHPCRDWKAFEPLIGHAPSEVSRGRFGRLRRLKPAQIADLLEEAGKDEGAEILHHVHADPELEADVFEELDPDIATRLFADRTDDEVAGILSRMRADDAADAVADLPQSRRQPLLDALPIGQRTKVLTLLGYNPSSAGGLMTVDILAVAPDVAAGAAVDAVRAARSLQPEALHAVYAVDAGGRLVGTAGLVALLQAEPGTALAELLDPDPVRVAPSTDLADVALLMADYNLAIVPVVDAEDRLLGVITFDDVLEATIPDEWRRREPPTRPDPAENADEAPHE